MTKAAAGLAVVLAAALAPLPVLSHTPDAPPLVKERQAAMDDMKDAMKALAVMVKGEAAFDAATAGQGAETIHGVTARIPELYPEGSYFERGHALPAVWDEPQAFHTEADDALAAAEALRAAVAHADDAATLAPAVKDVADACRDCHDDFKKDD